MPLLRISLFGIVSHTFLDGSHRNIVLVHRSLQLVKILLRVFTFLLQVIYISLQLRDSLPRLLALFRRWVTLRVLSQLLAEPFHFLCHLLLFLLQRINLRLVVALHALRRHTFMRQLVFQIVNLDVLLFKTHLHLPQLCVQAVNLILKLPILVKQSLHLCRKPFQRFQHLV